MFLLLKLKNSLLSWCSLLLLEIIILYLIIKLSSIIDIRAIIILRFKRILLMIYDVKFVSIFKFLIFIWLTYCLLKLYITFSISYNSSINLYLFLISIIDSLVIFIMIDFIQLTILHYLLFVHLNLLFFLFIWWMTL